MSFALFDIGGTNTRIAISDDLTSFRDVKKLKTPADPKKGVEEIVSHVKAYQGKGKLAGVAGGIRGVLDHEKTMLANDDTLSKWVDFPLVKTLTKQLRCNTFLENDTAVVGLGEYHFGAGAHAEIMVYHTVSTGVGGVKIENGVVDAATFGFEPGHQTLDIDRTILGDNIAPTLENLISGGAVEKRMGMKPYEIPQDDVIWDELAGYLGQGLRNTIMYWSPEVIVLGGSMIIGDPRIRLEDIRRHTVAALDDFLPCPLIVDAKLKDEGGLYGAMALLQQQI